MEIERKFLIQRLPEHLDAYPFQLLEQAYLCTEPVVRIRRSDDSYTLTYKSKGLMSREEYNLPLTFESYEHLKKKADGNIIRKKRYRIPLPDELTIELDLFDPPFEGLILAEVEFTSEEQARAFLPPEWFGEEVTWSTEYHNSTLSQRPVS
ncbi:adenylate cyclase [bacterium 1XD21-13]|nr:adenylate cyclase [bacterium 1XD21-13]